MVLSDLENQSHCWKGLTVSSPDWNMQNKESVVTSVLLLLWSLVKSQSRNKWRIPVVPPSSSKTTGKSQSPGHRCLGMATRLCSSSLVPGIQEHHEGSDEGTGHAAGMVDPAPWAVQGQGKPRNAWLLRPGGKKDCSYCFL